MLAGLIARSRQVGISFEVYVIHSNYRLYNLSHVNVKSQRHSEDCQMSILTPLPLLCIHRCAYAMQKIFTLHAARAEFISGSADQPQDL